MINKYICFFSIGIGICYAALFEPKITTANKRRLTLYGKGPPVLISTGLYDAMPLFLYRELVESIKHNFTIVNVEDVISVQNSDDVSDVVNALKSDKISIISHSSFNPSLLSSDKIEKIVLLDPITIPSVSFSGVQRDNIKLDYPTLVIKAEKLYRGEKTLPKIQQPEIGGANVTHEIYLNVGHPDILDDIWANFAKTIGIWEMVDDKPVEYKTWRYNYGKNISVVRKRYRKYVSDRIISFLS
tara:strand:- start:63 stop:791 length:729 start_codon:yes stop_codon:yes gene_type:complete